LTGKYGAKIEKWGSNGTGWGSAKGLGHGNTPWLCGQGEFFIPFLSCCQMHALPTDKSISSEINYSVWLQSLAGNPINSQIYFFLLKKKKIPRK